MVPSYRRALRALLLSFRLKDEREPGWFPLIGGRCARLLSFRYIDGICLRIS